MAENTTEDWEKWTEENPPVEGAFLTERGWEIPLKGTDPADGLTEVIVCMRDTVSDEAAEANIVGVAFVEPDTPYGQGDTLQVEVTFNELVDVTAGATITITSTGGGGDFVATAAAQTDTNVVLFEATIPSETAELSISAQTVTGTVTDDADATASDLTVTAPVAAAAGTVDIA